MKVLLVNKFLYPRGGAETYFLKVGRYLTEQGHDVEYFGMYDEKNTVSNSCHAYTTNMDFHGTGIQRFSYPFQILYSHEAKKKIKRVIQCFQPDIVHFNNINFQLTPSILDGAAQCGVPLVQTVHDLQMLCPNHLMFSPKEGGVCEKCMHGSKLHCVAGKCIHGSLAKSGLGTLEAWLYRVKKSYTLLDRLICPSHFLEEKLLTNQRFQGKTVVKQNFVELTEVENLPSKGDYVLYFGRLSEEKGIRVLMEACSKLPQIPFVVAGSGPEEALCQQHKNVKFVGFQTGGTLKELIARARFTVHPSICYENCPLSVLESEALGTPVLCVGQGGFLELVEDGKTGRVLDRNMTADSLAEGIQELYNSPSLLDDMSQNCIRERENMVTLKQYGEWLTGIYQETIQAYQPK